MKLSCRGLGCSAEHAAGECDAERQGSIENGSSELLRPAPILRVLRIIWSIPSNNIILLFRLPLVFYTLVELIILWGCWIPFLNVPF